MSRYNLEHTWGPSTTERMRRKFKNYFGALEFNQDRMKTSPGFCEYHLYMPEHIILSPEELRSVCDRHTPGGGYIGIIQRGVPPGQPLRAFKWESKWYWKKPYNKGVGKIEKVVNKKTEKTHNVVGRV